MIASVLSLCQSAQTLDERGGCTPIITLFLQLVYVALDRFTSAEDTMKQKIGCAYCGSVSAKLRSGARSDLV